MVEKANRNIHRHDRGHLPKSQHIGKMPNWSMPGLA
jgi:hypothetical protein